MVERVLDHCCGFLYNTLLEEEPSMINRFFNDKLHYINVTGTLNRRAFLVTRTQVKEAIPLIPNELYVQTLTPWDADKIKAYPKGSHHVKSYEKFYDQLIVDKLIHNIAGFDGKMDSRQEEFSGLMNLYPEKWRMAILSNSQHKSAEPFLLKNGFKPVIRGRNSYWYDNHLTIFVHPPTAEEKAA